jgi:ligand-binding SRPBCC domain-containing protein
VIDHTFSNEKTRSITIPSEKMWTHSHNEGHLQDLTPSVINRVSINKVFDQLLKPLCRCVIQSEVIVIDRNFCYEKMRLITKPVKKY